MFESFLGALFIDLRFNVNKMEDIFFRVFGGFLEVFTSQEMLEMTALSGIKRICEELGLGMPKIK